MVERVGLVEVSGVNAPQRAWRNLLERAQHTWNERQKVFDSIAHRDDDQHGNGQSLEVLLVLKIAIHR